MFKVHPVVERLKEFRSSFQNISCLRFIINSGLIDLGFNEISKHFMFKVH